MSCLGQWVSSQCLGQWASLCHIWVNGAISCLGPGSEGLAVSSAGLYYLKRSHKDTLTLLVLPGSGLCVMPGSADLYVPCMGQHISMCHAWDTVYLCYAWVSGSLCAMHRSTHLISMWHACLGLQVPQCHAWASISLCHAWVSRSLCYALVNEYQRHVGPLQIVRERHLSTPG